MAYRIRCPVCGDDFSQPQGLHGHLRFSHELSGDELDEVYERAQQQDHFDFVEDEGSEDGGEPSEEEQPESLSVDSGSSDRSPAQERRGSSSAFDWERRLDRMDEIRASLKRLDRSEDRWESEGGIFGSTFGRKVEDEGCREALKALDDIEMEVRERLGASDADPELRSRVDESLEQLEALVRCREQREAIAEKFSGQEGAQERIDRLDKREVEIRLHVRRQWDAGKPTEELDEEDPVAAIERDGGNQGE